MPLIRSHVDLLDHFLRVPYFIFSFVMYNLKSAAWRGVRAVEGARLESACTVTPYRGFESLPLRQFQWWPVSVPPRR